METVTDINSPYISSYAANALSNNSVDKISKSTAITKPSNELTVTDGIRLHERALSQSITNATTGIALSNIAQNGLNQQKDILNEIKQLTIQSFDERLNQQDREFIANEIATQLQNFDSVVETTNYNGEALLKVEGDSSDDLSIIGEEKIVSIYKVDTPSISESLRVFLGDFPIKDKVRENMINILDQNIDDLSSYVTNYGNTSNQLESMVKKQLTEVTDSATDKEVIKNVDFGQEVTDFNKTNLLSQMGYLMQTQANAHTQRTVEVLK